VYAQRLGLWGPGSAFADFGAFLESMKKRGVTFLEMLSMEMKAEGYYVARGLSYKSPPPALPLPKTALSKGLNAPQGIGPWNYSVSATSKRKSIVTRKGTLLLPPSHSQP
jgi:hypothetical protein